MTYSKSIQRRLKAQRDDYRDCHGVAFDDVRYILGEDRSKWPKVTRVTDPDVCEMFHKLHHRCWECGASASWPMRIEAHHMFAGSSGKTDEACAIAVLCGLHHGQQSEPILPLGRLLYLKWHYDSPHVDWVRMTLLRGSFLPDLIVTE